MAGKLPMQSGVEIRQHCFLGWLVFCNEIWSGSVSKIVGRTFKIWQVSVLSILEIKAVGLCADWFLIHLFWIDSIIDSFDIFSIQSLFDSFQNFGESIPFDSKNQKTKKRNDSRLIKPKSYRTILFWFDSKKFWTKILAIISTQCIFTYEEHWKKYKLV